jgi:hypothetical protein
MLVSTWSPDGTKSAPPPLWQISDGLRTVGPVTTTALVQHVKDGRVTDHCAARPSRWRPWRVLDRVREIRAVRSALYGRGRLDGAARRITTTRALLGLAEGPDALELALRLAADGLNADLGFVHVFEGGHKPITRHALGAGAEGRIGCPLLDGDVMAHVARTHCLAVGDVDRHHGFKVAASRLGGRAAEVRGVAMVPVIGRRGLVAMIELGRTDHAFRASDATWLRQVVALAGARV